MATPWVSLVVGLIALVGGAEALVRGASRLALLAGMSPLIIGLTVVAVGTSAPELAVSLKAALGGRVGVSVGNVIGSNIFNVLVILGLAAVAAPLAAHRQVVRTDVPYMIAVSGLLFALVADGRLGRGEGVALVGLLIAYTVWLIRQGGDETDTAGDRPRGLTAGALAVLAVSGGLLLLVQGADWLVAGAITLARGAGLSELTIGLTVVAAGTSLPELATSVVATLRGQRDIAVGNVVGSNVFNLLGVLGLSAVVADGLPVAPEALRVDLPVMLGAAVVCLPLLVTGGRLSRPEGGLLVAWYVAYVAWLILDQTGHDGAGGFAVAMLGFVLPLTALGLATGWLAHVRVAKVEE